MRYLINLWEFIKSPGPMALIAIVSLIFGIYATWFYEKRPALTFEVISNSNVYDIHENLGKLDVIYSGKSLRANKQVLRLINFRIINSGQTSFTKNDFDDTDTLGFAIDKGTILETPAFIGSTDYLQTHTKPTLVDSTEIRFAPLIIDAGEFIEVHALVSANEGAEPTVRPLGKLAGVKKMQVNEPSRPANQRSFWNQIVDANSIWVQVARVPVYVVFGMLMLVLFAFSLILLVVPFESFTNYKNKLSRVAKMNVYSQGKSLSPADRHVIEKYLNEGDVGIRRLIRIQDRISIRNYLVSVIGDKTDEGVLEKILKSTFPLSLGSIDHLEAEGLLKKNGLVLTLEDDFTRAVKELAQFIGISLETAKFEYLDEDIALHSALKHEA